MPSSFPNNKVIVSNHAKKRLKQRVHKNWQEAAEAAYRYGVDHGQLKGRLRKHLNWLAYNDYKYTATVTVRKIYNEYVYLFNDNVLVTVLRLPKRFVNLARRLTEENTERITARMKTAKIIPFVVDVICPHCEGQVRNPDQGDSLMWEIGEIIEGKVVKCDECGEEFKLPKIKEGELNAL